MQGLIRWYLRRLCEVLSDPVWRRRSRKSRLAIVRLDEIGDYVLFRNYLCFLKQSAKYRDYAITLIGNARWECLAEYYDKDVVNKFIWIDKAAFECHYLYRYWKLRQMKKSRYTVTINPIRSRDCCMLADYLVERIFSEEKIGWLMPPDKSEQNYAWYTRLIVIPCKLRFEFDANRFFMAQLIGEDVSIALPQMTRCPDSSCELPGNYAAIFIGASNPIRVWPMGHVARTARCLHERYGLKIVLCGGPDAVPYAAEVMRACGEYVTNLVGKTSLLDLVYILRHARLVLSNDSCAPHLAVALGCKHIFVVSNGNHFGRFHPYPAETRSFYHIIYPECIMRELDNPDRLWMLYGAGSGLAIAEISADGVMAMIQDNAGGLGSVNEA